MASTSGTKTNFFQKEGSSYKDLSDVCYILDNETASAKRFNTESFAGFKLGHSADSARLTLVSNPSPDPSTKDTWRPVKELNFGT